MGDGGNELYLSAATCDGDRDQSQCAVVWQLPEPPESYVPSRLVSEGFQTLPVELGHALRVARLP